MQQLLLRARLEQARLLSPVIADERAQIERERVRRFVARSQSLLNILLAEYLDKLFCRTLTYFHNILVLVAPVN